MTDRNLPATAGTLAVLPPMLWQTRHLPSTSIKTAIRYRLHHFYAPD